MTIDRTININDREKIESILKHKHIVIFDDFDRIYKYKGEVEVSMFITQGSMTQGSMGDNLFDLENISIIIAITTDKEMFFIPEASLYEINYFDAKEDAELFEYMMNN